MNNSALSIRDSFAEKTIFVIGGTGFIGKVWLAMMLDYVPNLKKIVILVRPSKGVSGLDRFNKIYKTSPVFTNLHKIYGNNLNEIKKIQIVEGDVSLLKFGLKQNSYQKLIDETDITLNFAADLRFNAPLNETLKVNTEGPLNIVDFILASKKSTIVQVSTCYVAGKLDGLIQENIFETTSPNGTPFCAEEEYKWAKKESELAKSKHATATELTNIGINRAERLGWANTYTYSKALGEILLSQKIPKSRYCIFRPSIVESSVEYPFPGWNEDFNGTAPFVMLLKSRYRVLVAKPENNLDVIPVDLVARGLTIVSAALINNVHSNLYHCASSSVNPLTVKNATDYIINYYKPSERKSLDGLILPYPKTKFVSPKHILSGQSIKKIESKFTKIVENFLQKNKSNNLIKPLKIRIAMKAIKNKAKMIDTISKIYKPFIYDYNYVFSCNNILSHKVLEKEFEFQPQEINWTNYWNNIHLPGLKKWCLPQLNKAEGNKK